MSYYHEEFLPTGPAECINTLCFKFIAFNIHILASRVRQFAHEKLNEVLSSPAIQERSIFLAKMEMINNE